MQKAWSWTIVDRVFEKCSTSCMLQIDFVDFEKEYVHCIHYKRLNCSPLPNSILSKWQSKVVAWLTQPSCISVHVYVFIYCWT
jgi:hypothetical protein